MNFSFLIKKITFKNENAYKCVFQNFLLCQTYADFMLFTSHTNYITGIGKSLAYVRSLLIT